MTAITCISLGAGVQSSTMALMAARGELTPMPVAAVFADTQAEPADVYLWLDWLEKQLPFPVIRTTRGDLAEDACRVRHSKGGKNYTKHAVPAFIKETVEREDEYGGSTRVDKVGLAMRQCTTDHKIDLIYRAYTKLRGGSHKGSDVEQWVGISVDEASRMKPARRTWVTNRYPLVEKNISRNDCLAWMKTAGYPTPPRSACVFCPYHNDAEWVRMRDEVPAEFAAAVAFERNYQTALGQVSGFRGVPYLHRSCVPLETVQFRPTLPSVVLTQTNLNFTNECEGMCGV